MLSKTERLKERYLFNTAFSIGKKNGQKLSSDLLLLYYLFRKKRESEVKLPKTAFIVGIKVEKKANKRNLVKRRMRSAYRVFRERLINNNNLKKISVLIWIANQNIKNATFKQIKDSMENLLRRLENKACD